MIIVAEVTNNGVPVPSPANTPTIRIRRLSDNGLAVTDDATTVVGDGSVSYDFTTSATEEYVARVDCDPTGSGQTTVRERYKYAAFSGIVEARIEADVPAILADTAAMQPLVDVAVSSRAAPGDAMDLVADSVDEAAIAASGAQEFRDAMKLAPTAGAPAAGSVDEHLDSIELDTGTTIPAAIAALNDLSQADVQAAMTSQGYTAARALLLDNLDAQISSVVTAIAGLNDLSASEAASAVWDALRSAHTTTNTYGRAMTLLLDGMVSRGLIDTTTTPWREVRYVFDEGSASDTIVAELYDLYDQDGVAIAGTPSSGNNPLNDSTRLIAERRRV